MTCQGPYRSTVLGRQTWDSALHQAPATPLTPEAALATGATLTLSAATGLASDDTLKDIIVLIHCTAAFSD